MIEFFLHHPKFRKEEMSGQFLNKFLKEYVREVGSLTVTAAATLNHALYSLLHF
jgi:hypothetical protein